MGKDDVSTYAADVFSFILRQSNSRFQRNLVDSGLSAGVNLGYYSQRNVGPITLVMQTTPDKARAAVRAVYDEIARFNDPAYFTEEELESAKALLEADDLYSREKLSSYTHVIGFWWSSAGLDYYRGYLKRLRSTSRADISRYVSTSSGQAARRPRGAVARVAQLLRVDERRPDGRRRWNRSDEMNLRIPLLTVPAMALLLPLSPCARAPSAGLGGGRPDTRAGGRDASTDRRVRVNGLKVLVKRREAARPWRRPSSFKAARATSPWRTRASSR
jgi:hypothetical protein